MISTLFDVIDVLSTVVVAFSAVGAVPVVPVVLLSKVVVAFSAVGAVPVVLSLVPKATDVVPSDTVSGEQQRQLPQSLVSLPV